MQWDFKENLKDESDDAGVKKEHCIWEDKA